MRSIRERGSTPRTYGTPNSSCRPRVGRTKSTFLRGLIRNTSFSNAKNRGYIYDLLRLEEYITDGYHGWASAVHYRYLKDQYRYEWEKLYAELRSDQWKELVGKGEQTYVMRLDMDKTIKANAREEVEQARRRWLAAGGRP